MAAKDMVCGGVRRRIGNENSTLIWEHLDPMIHMEMPPQLSGAKVEGLIDQDTGTWDPQIVVDIFQPSDVPRILKIPVSPEQIIGNYTSSNNGEFDKWLTLWKLKIPPKWKTFLWRAISNILPTTTNLLIKRVDVDPTCAMCGIMQEDTMHSLVTCGYATAILYHIWRARNGAVWDACLPLPGKLITMTVANMQAWRAVHCTTAARMADDTAAADTAGLPLPLPPDAAASTSTAMVKAATARPRRCYVDARYHHSVNSATVGAILLDEDRSYVAAFSIPLPSCLSPPHG
ncbi:PREDICTED: uncharacterized protein LOC109192681 [Ipomoea nil]|uniref:uncharacterized protein LOC109192681 n=1 Tax=Ipomoea nil TaxID=35883 RepID=UPI0009015E86|nr:PREDICTED: uncharacterized protein LOC109192681 [Ipomoea nil]